MQMRADVVVPEPIEIQVLLGLRGQPDRPLAGQLLEGLEEPPDAAVLPGREGRDSLMPDAEQAETEPEECGGEDGLIVGTDAPRPAEALDRVQDDAKDRDVRRCSGLIVGPRFLSAETLDRVQDDAKDRNRGLVAHVSQCQTGSGAVVEKPENGAFAETVAEVGEIGSPDDSEEWSSASGA